jgi:hypothetical protein
MSHDLLCRRWLCLVGYAVWLGRCGTSHFGKLSQTIIIPVNTNSHNEDSMFGGFRHRRRKYKQGPEPTEMEKKIHCSERARGCEKCSDAEVAAQMINRFSQVCQT